MNTSCKTRAIYSPKEKKVDSQNMSI